MHVTIASRKLRADVEVAGRQRSREGLVVGEQLLDRTHCSTATNRRWAFSTGPPSVRAVIRLRSAHASGFFNEPTRAIRADCLTIGLVRRIRVCS